MEAIDPIVSLDSVSVTEFKKRAARVINNVLSGRPIALLRNNKPETVLITLEDYFDLVETWRERGLKDPADPTFMRRTTDAPARVPAVEHRQFDSDAS